MAFKSFDFEYYSINASCTLNLISTFLFVHSGCWILIFSLFHGSILWTKWKHIIDARCKYLYPLCNLTPYFFPFEHLVFYTRYDHIFVLNIHWNNGKIRSQSLLISEISMKWKIIIKLIEIQFVCFIHCICISKSQ